jgi:hypothetical protein
MISMFQAVSDLNVAYGNSKGDPTNPDWARLESQAKNILDEYNELMDDGISVKNITEVRDAICDILVFTLGLAHMAGLPVEEDMEAVDASNRTKFCRNNDELGQTAAKYRDLGVEVYVEGSFPSMRVKSLKDQVGLDGKNYPANKMLKSVAFVEPMLKPLVSSFDLNKVLDEVEAGAELHPLVV